MRYFGKTGEYLEIVEVSYKNCKVLKESNESQLSLLWFQEDNNKLLIDGKEYTFHANQIVCLTEFHKVETKKVYELKLLRFNRDFYCILDHDSEVGCKGILYFGSAQLPVFKIQDSDLDQFKTVWKMFEMEMDSQDELQLEMLQMMLKRFLILCTRVYKKETNITNVDHQKADIIREFNFLVELHFKTKHTVSEYADLLFKSPKTISNLFRKIGTKTPLQFIQERILLEARRLLRYTRKPISDIAYELGYVDLQTFSRFFKKQEGHSPTEYREMA